MAGDIQLTCSDCGQDFTFTAADQAFFQERGYSTPKRCKPCRMAKKNDQGGSGAAIVRLRHRVRLSSVRAAASRPLFPSSPAAIVRFFAGTATRRAKAVAVVVAALRADAVVISLTLPLTQQA